MFFKRLNGKSQFRVLLLIIAVIFATENTLAADASRPFEEWVEQLKGLEGHKAAAFRVGPELVKLEPDFGLKVVETAWGELADYKVKTGLLKAFHWGKSLRPKKHRHVIKILHLGMTDSNSQVRDYASYYLQDYSMEDFRDNQAAYLTWYKEFGNRPIEEIVRLNKLRTPSNRPVLERKLKEIVKAFQQGDIMQTQKLANEISMFSDPFAIPTLIGIIDADNSYDTVYRIGRSALSSGSALGKVTQVDYSYYHDGAWWRRWPGRGAGAFGSVRWRRPWRPRRRSFWPSSSGLARRRSSDRDPLPAARRRPSPLR